MFATQTVSNITEKTIGSRTVRIAYDKTNRIVSVRDEDGIRRFNYDSAGRLVNETLNGEPVASFTYGYLDKVMSVTRGGKETQFHYNASGMLVCKGQANERLEPWQWPARRSFSEGGDGLALVARSDDAYINKGHVSGASALISRSLSGPIRQAQDGTTNATC